MKKRIPTRALSTLLAIVTIMLTFPFVSISAIEIYDTNDYTPFLIETLNGKSVYNAQTADMTYDFYLAARSYIDDNGKDSLKHDGQISFTTNGVTYNMNNVYYSKPKGDHLLDWESTCGVLTGILNFEVNGEAYHVVLIAFRGTDGFYDVMTDMDFIEKADGYHSGFHNAARNHYNRFTESVYYTLENGQSIGFTDYLDKMCSESNYKMIVTGHSLGAAAANVFTSKFVNGYKNMNTENVVAYTYASPLTCSSNIANSSVNTNIFNLLNKDDIVTKVGAYDGTRVGKDLAYRLNKYNKVSTNLKGLLSIDAIVKFVNYIKKSWNDIGNNHHMGTAYDPVKSYVNSHINDYVGTFVLYTNYDSETNTHQRIVYDNGQLIVSGSGELNGNWSENTFVDFAKIRNKCTSLIFNEKCKITEIGDYAFSGMTQLGSTLNLPETITTIGDYAFFHCGFIGELIIPSKVVSVGISAFNGCSNLNKINAKNALSMTWGYGAFANCVGQHDLLLPVEDSGTDLAKIFKTYYVQDNNGSYLIDVDDATSGNIVLPGDKIYIGRIEDDKLNIRPYYDFHYLLTTGHTDTADNIQTFATNAIANVASVDESGCVTILDNCQSGTEFTVVVMDNYKGNPDYDVYDSNRFIHFTVGSINDKFAGGIGTKERPYLIKNYDQLTRIKDYPSACYRLISNIDCSNETAWKSIESFSGSIDGMGYKISNLSGAKFIANNAGGYIKNLYLIGWNITSGGRIVGIIAGDNCAGGVISNCHISDSSISVEYYTNDADCWHNVGGFVAFNNGTISECSIINTKLNGYAKGGNNHYDVYLNMGGIAARNFSTGNIYNCASYNNVIYGYIYHNATMNNKSEANFRLGGVVGYAEGGTINSVTYDNNKISKERDWYDHWGYEDGKYATVNENYCKDGVAKSKITANCTQDSSQKNFYNIITGIYIEKIIVKTHYYIGESLNIYGLVVRDVNNDIIVNGYTVSGFDSSKSGSQTLVVTYVTGYGNFTDTFTITVENVIPQTVVVQPQEDYYDIQDTLSVDDFTATIYYNNGTIEKLNSLAENQKGIVRFTSLTNWIEAIETQILQLNYYYAYMTSEGKVAASSSITVYVAVNITCSHIDTNKQNAMPATVSEYGYTGDIVCSTCKSIVEEGTVIEMLECADHSFTAWTKYDENQHSHTCECGEVEYEDHIWNEGKVTTEPTHTTFGIKTYTCSACGATRTEQVAKLTTHTYSAWTKYDEKQHYHTCECGDMEYEDHSWDDGTITMPATYENDGVKTYTCSACGAKYTSVIPKPESVHTLIIDGAGAMPGGTVQINVRLEKNPGVAMLRLKLSYDSSVLKLNKVEYNEAIGGTATQPSSTDGSVILLWYNDSQNVEGDWIFATLTFTIDESAKAGTTSNIVLTYDAEEVCDIEENNVVFSIENGMVSVWDHIAGDINGDGELTSKDLLRLARYFANWDVEVNEKALDVNNDGVSNSKDLLRLARYLADWDVEIY